MDLTDYLRLYKQAEDDPVRFWSQIANELDWFEKWDTALSIDKVSGKVQWFINGKTNISYNCLDRHIKSGKGNKIAVIWEGLKGEIKKYTYNQLFTEVNKVAKLLINKGIKLGDNILILLPKTPELIIFSLAGARIGATTIILDPIEGLPYLKRIIEMENPKIIVTIDGLEYGTKIIPIAKRVYELRKHEKFDYSIIATLRVKRYNEAPLVLDRDDCELSSCSIDDRVFVWSAQVNSDYPLYKIVKIDKKNDLLKVYVYSHGDHMVGLYATMKYIFTPNDKDIIWCTAKVGTLLTQSYGIFAPLLVGSTTFLYEGNGHEFSREISSLVQKHNISLLYAHTDDIRKLLKLNGPSIRNLKISNLRVVATAGPPLDKKEWTRLHGLLGHIPILDTLVSEDLGIIVFAPFQYVPLKPTSVFRPFPGIIISIQKRENDEIVKFKLPWPGMPKEIHIGKQRFSQLDILENKIAKFELFRTKDNYFYVREK